MPLSLAIKIVNATKIPIITNIESLLSMSTI